MSANESYDATFWDGCGHGRFLLQHCADSGHLQYPPGPVCRQCGSAIARWVESARSGTVQAFSLVRRAPTAEFKPMLPYMVGIVRLAEGPIVETWLQRGGRTPEIGEVSIGYAVTIEFQVINGKMVPVARMK